MIEKKKTIKKTSEATKVKYTSEQIQVLEGVEHVRKRPGMYVGSTGPEGLHHLIWEVVDNVVDEVMADRATTANVILNEDGSMSVWDDGNGIPVDIHKQKKVSALELVMTTLGAGGKFGQEDSAYKVSGGLHGVGVSVANALSEWAVAEVHSGGHIHVQEYKAGKPLNRVKNIGKIGKVALKTKVVEPSVIEDEAWNKQSHGTRVTLYPDKEIFESIGFDWMTMMSHFRQQAYLTKGIKISIQDNRCLELGGHETRRRSYTFHFTGGIATYVKYLNRHKESKQEEVFYVDKEMVPVGERRRKDPIKVEVALQYTDDIKESVFSYTNNITNPEGGSHVVGFRTALTRVLNVYARDKGILKEKDDNLQGEDVREGLTAVISVGVREPQFEGQTKGKLGNPEVKGVVDQVMSESFTYFLETRPKEAETIIGKAILAQRARVAAKAARESVLRKGVLDGFTLPGKLADCSSKVPEQCEIFLVEGDSAGGSAKQGRNREFQAILPLRGKILNVERARLDKMLANEEIKSLIIALGTNFGEQYEDDKLRYSKVVIMTDADVDGSHIRTLLLTLFYRYFPELIRQGHLFIAQPPLYGIKKGKQIFYVYTDEEKEEKLNELSAAKEAKEVKGDTLVKSVGGEAVVSEENIDQTGVGEKISGLNIQRYKGLGEMNADELWNTTMDPEARHMKIVTIEDAAVADNVFDMLMGAEVAPRKKFIQTHAKTVENLDV